MQENGSIYFAVNPVGRLLPFSQQLMRLWDNVAIRGATHVNDK